MSRNIQKQSMVIKNQRKYIGRLENAIATNDYKTLNQVKERVGKRSIIQEADGN